MTGLNKKCKNCGELLKQTQYGRGIGYDGATPKAAHYLVCRNYPKCKKAEVDVDLTTKQ